MKRIKGVIFDYGGTLDTNGVHWFHIFCQAYAQYLPQITEEQLREVYVYAERYLATHRVIEHEDDFLAMLRKKVTIQLSELKIENEELNDKIASYCDTLVRNNMNVTRRVLDVLSARCSLATGSSTNIVIFPAGSARNILRRIKHLLSLKDNISLPLFLLFSRRKRQLHRRTCKPPQNTA